MSEYAELNIFVSRNVTPLILIHTDVTGKVSARILNVEDYSLYLSNK
jgi:hypothetical protein